MKDANLPVDVPSSVWRRKLTDAERAELCVQPEVAAELEMESRLSEVLAKRPDIAVPSNFTSRVLQAVEREEANRPAAGSWLELACAFAPCGHYLIGAALRWVDSAPL